MVGDSQLDTLEATGEVRERFAGAEGAPTAIERDRAFSALHAKMFGAANAVKIGRFVVESRLGAGAMGVVYAARDPELDRRVALKLLRGPTGDTLATARIEREARALAKLRHPNVVTVHEVGSHDGDRFIAMDLVEGETLGAWLKPTHGYREVLAIMIEAGRGLAAAHDAGLVHRDFKPDNVLVEDGHARVVDFGLARPESAVDAERTEPDCEPMPSGRDVLTKTGAVVGTPAYMAPEAFGGETDPRCDQFSFCVTLYEALYGARPFVADSIVEQLEAIRNGDFVRGDVDRGTPARLRRVVVRGLAEDPRDRWPSMATLLEALDQQVRRPKTRRLALAAVGGTLLGAVVVAVYSGDESVCRRSGERMDTVWSRTRRAAIESAFAATELPYAADASKGAADSVGRYAKDWVAMRQSSCEATFERAEQSETLFDARTRCLDRRLEELDAVLTAFEAPDAEVVGAAVAAAHGLGALDDCADGPRLRAEIERMSAGDAVEAPAELYTRLARARAQQRTAKFTEASSEAEAVAEEATAAGDHALASRAHMLRASVQDRLAEDKAAERSVRLAIIAAERAGDNDARARAQTLLVSLLAQRHALVEGEQWLMMTRATIERLGQPPELRATLLAHHSDLSTGAGRYEESLRTRRESLELRQSYLEPGDPILASSHEGVGETLVNLGRAEEGLAELRTALALRVASLGEFHPDVARTHGKISRALQELGRMPESIEASKRAIELTVRSLGPHHPEVAAANANLAIALAQQPDPKASIPYFRQAIAIFERANGPDSLPVAYQLGNLGRVLAFDLEADEAVPTLQRALAIDTDVLGPDHPDNLYVLNSLTTALSLRKRYVEALPYADRAVQVGTKAFDGDHPTLADAWLRLGVVQRQLGELDAAMAALQTSVDMCERLDGRPAAVAQPRMELARVYALLGDEASTLREMEQVRDALVADPMEHAAWLGQVEAWLNDPSAPI